MTAECAPWLYMGGVMAQTEDRRLVGFAHDEIVSSVNFFEVIGGGLFRVTFYVNRTDSLGNILQEPAEFALVMPLTSLPDAIGKALVVAGRRITASTDSLTVSQH